jgi:zinc transport system substrate-binding protein
MTGIAYAGLLVTVISGCSGQKEPEEQSGPPVVYTTFYPTTYFVERLSGDHLEVVCPIPEDEDPIFWNPPRDVLAGYQAADLIVVNGAEFEKWVAHVSLPASRILDTAAGLPDGFVTFEATQHRHGAGGEHTHEGIDGHTWVDPLAASYQVGRIKDELIGMLPEHERAFRQAAAALREELADLHARLIALGPRMKGVTLLASHPAYNYLVRSCGWEIKNFDLDPDVVPGEIQVKEIAEALPGTGARILLWEGEPLSETIALFRERLRIESVLFSPVESLSAERRAAGEDYLTVMNANLDRLEAALP